MNLEEAISTVREFMGSYTGNHGDAMRIIVAEVERRKTVRSAVQQRKAEIALCHLKGVVCGFQYTSKALHCGSSRRCDKATSAVA